MKAEEEMDDLDRFIEQCKKESPEFAEGFDEGYENFTRSACCLRRRENRPV